MKRTLFAACAALSCLPAVAHETEIRADSHAPIGVMGDHTHKKGEVMFSYRFMHMGMGGNRIGTDQVSPETIATTVPNRFFGAPMQPPTHRVVPTRMSMDMHMVGAMYAPTDWLTLMAMGNYITKTMDHVTFQGATGTTRLGGFTTRASGFGDTKLAALIRAWSDHYSQIHINAGISIPTGSTEETDRVLTPMGTTPSLRLPYPMQLGSGTVDLEPGVTYRSLRKKWGWGAQYKAAIRLGDNNGYSHGDTHEATAWASYLWAPEVSTSLRVTGSSQGKVDGIDPGIIAPVQTANPDFQGGERVELGFGLNLLGTKGVLEGHRVSAEVAVPIFQDLNGPQMERDWTITVGYQYAF